MFGDMNKFFILQLLYILDGLQIGTVAQTSGYKKTPHLCGAIYFATIILLLYYVTPQKRMLDNQ